jgi:hypothetical protein
MGVSYTAFLKIGFEVSKSDFFEQDGVIRRCAKKHETTEDHKFCSRCGGEIREESTLFPTKSFKDFAAKRGRDVFDLWNEMLRDDITSTHALQGGDAPDLEDMAICIVLRAVDMCDDGVSNPVGEKELEEAKQNLMALMRELKIYRPIELYQILEVG